MVTTDDEIVRSGEVFRTNDDILAMIREGRIGVKFRIPDDKPSPQYYLPSERSRISTSNYREG
ncbi:MAG TPA: hypothetical protein DHW45_01875 [Candidatus Latescibacteria bacterium]|nr:hypothetical protein [Candidatus Latescibacterota bacterium]